MLAGLDRNRLQRIRMALFYMSTREYIGCEAVGIRMLNVQIWAFGQDTQGLGFDCIFSILRYRAKILTRLLVDLGEAECFVEGVGYRANGDEGEYTCGMS
jgi:hypothetical protein